MKTKPKGCESNCQRCVSANGEEHVNECEAKFPMICNGPLCKDETHYYPNPHAEGLAKAAGGCQACRLYNHGFKIEAFGLKYYRKDPIASINNQFQFLEDFGGIKQESDINWTATSPTLGEN